MYRLKVIVVGMFCLASGSVIALTTPGAQSAAKAHQERGWWRVRDGIEASIRKPAAQRMTVAAPTRERHSEASILRDFLEGQRLFESRDVWRQWTNLPDLPQP